MFVCAITLQSSLWQCKSCFVDYGNRTSYAARAAAAVTVRVVHVGEKRVYTTTTTTAENSIRVAALWTH